MKERTNPLPNEVWRHFKDREYKIIAIAEHTETGENRENNQLAKKGNPKKPGNEYI